ncbi:ExbD/TolR family protein [Saccharicrinis sp. FJH54]|uniref:ExbD/TolR family protein n=1 Tax=Saccharicrinis sp. FJH54 TaxID=3344665 RepID=UPI0035D527C1
MKILPVLVLISLVSCHMREVKPKDGVKPVEISVTDNGAVSLNGTAVEIDSIGPYVSRLFSTYSDEQRSKVVVNLTIEKNVKAGVISDIKYQLRKAKALKMNYRVE